MEEEKKELILEQGKSETSQMSSEPQKPVEESTKKPKKMLFILGALILVIVLTLVAIVFVNGIRPSTKMPPQEPENKLLATVGERKIYRNDAMKIALEQYARDAVNDKVLKTALDTAIERAILDKKAVELNIYAAGGTNKLVYYQNLRDEVISKEIGSVTANTISFWVPSFKDIYPQKPEYQQMRDLQPKVFVEATNKIKNGETMYNIGKYIIETYPVFKEQLGVNGYILSKMTNVSLMQKPITYQYDVNESNKRLFDFMFSLKKGDIKSLVMPDGEGASLVQVVDKSTGDKITYDRWLKEKMKGVVINSDGVSEL